MRPSRTDEYDAFHSAKSRCENKRIANYHKYGGRGIKFLFRDFNEFISSRGPRPKGKSLDRIDNNGHYEPKNCRWASRHEQSNNRSNNIIISYRNEKKTLAQWAQKRNIARHRLIYLLKTRTVGEALGFKKIKRRRKMDTMKRMKEWIKEVGKNESYIRLLRAGLSRSTAEKLIFEDNYPHKPGTLLTNAIEKAIKMKRTA